MSAVETYADQRAHDVAWMTAAERNVADFNASVAATCASHPDEHFTCSSCGETWCAWWTEQYDQCAACGASRCPCGGECKGKTGGHYVSVRQSATSERYVLAWGPFDTHAEALERVAAVRQYVEDHDPRGCWYAYGTARAVDAGEGKLNATMVAA